MKQKRATVLTTALIAIALFAFGSISRAQGPPPPPPPPGAYDAPPDGFSDAMRHAFIDGAQAARADYRAGLRPDPRRSDLFRHPPVPPPGRNDYHSAFGKGYEVATRHLTSRDSGGNDRGYDRGAPPPPPPPPGAMPPPPPPGTVPPPPPPPAPYEL